MKKSIIATLCLSLISVVALAKLPETISSLYVFGDSYSDQGNYTAQRVFHCMDEHAPQTNKNAGSHPGKIWSDFLAERYGIVSTASGNGGDNWAIVGTDSEHLVNQVRSYFKRDGKQADPNALYVVWSGLNDFFEKVVNEERSPAQVLIDGVTETMQAVTMLANHGARHVMVIGIPDVSLTPFISMADEKAQEDAHEFSYKWNMLIERSAVHLKKHYPHINLYQWDPVKIAEKLKAHPSEFGMPDVVPDKFRGHATNHLTWWCKDNEGNNPDHYLFFNPLQPTSALFKILADDMYTNAVKY